MPYYFGKQLLDFKTRFNQASNRVDCIQRMEGSRISNGDRIAIDAFHPASAF